MESSPDRVWCDCPTERTISVISKKGNGTAQEWTSLVGWLNGTVWPALPCSISFFLHAFTFAAALSRLTVVLTQHLASFTKANFSTTFVMAVAACGQNLVHTHDVVSAQEDADRDMTHVLPRDLLRGPTCCWRTYYKNVAGPAYFGEWHLDRRSGSGLTGTCNASMVERMQDKPLLPNSVVQSAIQFETFVVVSKNHVRGSTNKMLRKVWWCDSKESSDH
jgi:hypothetical protein